MSANREHRRIRVGVFGVGSLGQHHARIYAELPSAELIGVHDLDPARASEVAARHGTTAFREPGRLASRIEAASLAVPTDRHFEVFSLLAGHGLHLLVEKPIATRTDEAEEMVRIARERNVILQVGHVERFNPVLAFLEENLDRPRFIEATRLAPYPPAREGGVPRGTEVSVVLDLMIHDLDIILHLVRSPVREIHAVGVPVLSASEDIANTRLVFENGCVANVTASRVSRERLRKIRVFQEDLYLSLDYLNQAGRLHRRKGARIEVLEVPIAREEPLVRELAAFLAAVQTRTDPVVSGEHGSEALSLAVEICEQMARNPS